jgi:glycerophosphoryl diester phosphodiesterase
VIGHRGAAAVAPENTRASLEAAVAAGADLVEFDVGPELTLAHSSREAPREQLSLDAALELLRGHGLGVHVDLKQPGYEREVLEALDRHDLRDRAVVSTAWPVTTRRLATLAPDLPRAIGYPRDRYGISRAAWPAGLTRAGAAALRRAMGVRLPVLLRQSGATVLALHHTLCSASAVRAAHARGVPVLAWTANDEATIGRLSAAGVDGIVSDDPARALATLSRP